MEAKKYRRGSFEEGVIGNIEKMPYEEQLAYLKKQLHQSASGLPIPVDYGRALIRVAVDAIEGHYSGQSSGKALREKISDYQKVGLPQDVDEVRKKLEELTTKSQRLKPAN